MVGASSLSTFAASATNSFASVAVFSRRRVLAVGGQRSDAGRLRVGVVDGVAEAVAAEDDDEAVFADRLDEQFGARSP